MIRKVKIGGITFTTGFGKAVVKEYMASLGVSFNTGDLKGCDKIRWVITKEGESGSTFEEVSLTDAYTDMTINMVDYFNARFSETGSYVLYIQCLKGSSFAGGGSLQFYFCKYAYYQMGIKTTNKVRSAFSPCVFKYEKNGLHVDESTRFAENIVFEIGGYSEVRKVHDGVATFDAQMYLRQFFDGLDPWSGDKPVPVWDFVRKSPIAVDDSIVIKLMDSAGKMIGVDEYNLQPLYAVPTLFPDAFNSNSDGGKWRKRVLFYNLPMTLDLYQNTAVKDSLGFNFSVKLKLKKAQKGSDGIMREGGSIEAIADRADLTSIDFMRFFDCINGDSGYIFDLVDMINNGAYLTADKAMNTQLEEGDDRGVEITFNSSTCGTFCRWISRFGERCYWLFAAGEESFETKAGTTFERVTESFGEEKRTNVETTNIVKIGDVVYNEYVGFLCSFADGWAQQIYDPTTGRWSDIEVLDAKVSVGKKVAGNRVEFEIKKPQKNIVF